MPPPALSEPALVLCTISIMIVPLAGAGLALINTGLGRSRSAAHTMLVSLLVAATAAVVYAIVGFAWQGFAGRAAYGFMAGGKPWNWLAAEPFFFRGLSPENAQVQLAAWLQILAVGVAAMIPVGTGADRWRLSAACLSTALLAGWTYPLFAHWVWGGGWLAQLGINYNLGYGFLDAGGSSCIQVVGGLTALSVGWILGPRRGKYSIGGMPAAIPGHNAVLVLLGALFSLVGWIGLNCAGAILFTGAPPRSIPLIGMNTLLAASGAALTAALLTRTRFGKPDASLCANGWTGGLAASSAGCVLVAPWAAILIGIVAGVLVTIGVEWFELRFRVDDPGGAISVHAVGGLWGVLAAGIFAHVPGQLLAQIAGVATLVGFVLPLTYALNWLLNRFHPFRGTPEGEQQGMDLYELGAGAYPEFYINEEYQR